MLNHNASTLLLLPFASALLASKPLVQQAPLQIQITNVQKNNGKIVVEIYNQKSNWLQTSFRKTILSTDDNTKTISFNIPHGKYAISIYQDTNQNNKLDQNFLGIPKEPIGFGNNYKPFGKPDFESALIDYSSASKPEVIKLFSVL